MNVITEIIVSIFVLIGGFFSLLGSVGVIRLRNVYDRLHAATKSATLGVIGIMLATFLFFGFSDGVFSGKILVTIFFVFLTAPVAAHMLSQAAYRIGVPLWGGKKVRDDLKPVMEAQKNKAKNASEA